MAITRIILLTGETESPILSGELLRYNQSLDIVIAHDQADLTQAANKIDGGTRLLSFCTSVIVPSSLLKDLPGPAYNFHPGPPERPGRYPSVFALFDEAIRFGITVHEMAPSVDSGSIVDTEWFEIPKDCDLTKLESQTLTRLIKAFHRLAPYLAAFSQPLPHLEVSWQGRKTGKSDCDVLCRITPNMSANDVRRRLRACGTHISMA